MAKRSRAGSADRSLIQQTDSKSRRNWEEDDGPAKLSNHATSILKQWMLSEEHFDYPYPTPEVRSLSWLGPPMKASKLRQIEKCASLCRMNSKLVNNLFLSVHDA
jgi:hypothetical protein